MCVSKEGKELDERSCGMARLTMLRLVAWLLGRGDGARTSVGRAPGCEFMDLFGNDATSDISTSMHVSVPAFKKEKEKRRVAAFGFVFIGFFQEENTGNKARACV